MQEYEFRLVVKSASPFLPWMQSLDRPIESEVVLYFQPHFRYRNGHLETKHIKRVYAVYHDGFWFKWVHSVETPYRAWSRLTSLLFLHAVGNFQDPLTVENRHVLQLDAQAKLYTFRHSVHEYRLVFEWEPTTTGRLDRYRNIYQQLREYEAPSYQLNEALFRKPVTSVPSIPEGRQYLYAHKLDGTFGLVYSYRDKIKEKWEDYERVVRRGVSLGDGLVFAAERMEDGRVYLLDVYHVRGHDTAKWSRKTILTQFLPQLQLVEGYAVQTYERSKNLVPTSLKTDGIIIHDVQQDVVLKYKFENSIDLVYSKGYFQLPNGRIKTDLNGLEEGAVYEISTKDGSVLRKRKDRFKGNTAAQLATLLEQGWHGPPIEPLP